MVKNKLHINTTKILIYGVSFFSNAKFGNTTKTTRFDRGTKQLAMELKYFFSEILKVS